MPASKPNIKGLRTERTKEYLIVSILKGDHMPQMMVLHIIRGTINVALHNQTLQSTLATKRPPLPIFET